METSIYFQLWNNHFIRNKVFSKIKEIHKLHRCRSGGIKLNRVKIEWACTNGYYTLPSFIIHQRNNKTLLSNFLKDNPADFDALFVRSHLTTQDIQFIMDNVDDNKFVLLPTILTLMSINKHVCEVAPQVFKDAYHLLENRYKDRIHTKPNIINWTVLNRLATMDSLELVKFVMNDCKLSIKNLVAANGSTLEVSKLINIAASHGHIPTLDYILSQTDSNSLDYSKVDFIQICKIGHIDSLKLLKQYGNDRISRSISKYQITTDNNTNYMYSSIGFVGTLFHGCLEVAIRSNNLEMAKYLVDTEMDIIKQSQSCLKYSILSQKQYITQGSDHNNISFTKYLYESGKQFNGDDLYNGFLQAYIFNFTSIHQSTYNLLKEYNLITPLQYHYGKDDRNDVCSLYQSISGLLKSIPKLQFQSLTSETIENNLIH